ncbi:phosphatidylserine/phosphatidylglycerophosphate/ cardiolipinsynthase [Streptococcus pneumoniae]|nr:phosphatidylserine/phosphatidylglycerophosphate/ cardiolipinsynthase [Streptococcus pneumoniae]
MILTNTISKISPKMGWGSVFPIVVDQNPYTELKLEKRSTKILSNYRSLLHHYENAVLLYRTQSIIDIERDFEEIFKVSQEIYPHTIKTSWYQSLIKEIVQLFAPML